MCNVGIITPYTSQVNAIKDLVESEDVLIDTAYSFQGKEKDYIILSCVRSNHYKNLGILANS